MYTRRPAAVSYAFVEPLGGRTIHCEIMYDVIEPDPDVGYRGEVSLRGVFVTDVVCPDGERVTTRDPKWWEGLDAFAENHVGERDDWRDLAWDQWKSR